MVSIDCCLLPSHMWKCKLSFFLNPPYLPTSCLHSSPQLIIFQLCPSCLSPSISSPTFSPCGVHVGGPEPSVQPVPPAAVPLPGATGAGHLTVASSEAAQDETIPAGGKQKHETGCRLALCINWPLWDISLYQISLPQCKCVDERNLPTCTLEPKK